MRQAPEPTVLRREISRSAFLLGTFAVSNWAFWLSTQFDRVPPILKRGMQPSDIPQLVIRLIIFLGIWLLFRETSLAPERLTMRVQMTTGPLIGCVLIAEIDLIPGLELFAVSLAARWGERRFWTVALWALPGLAVTTGQDGYPLAQQGEAGRALGMAAVCSTIGGILSVVCLMAARR
ncbi:tripartite tricarboxylate transporter permease [Fluviibacterium sp. DFM31]|uniref:Tripartite tricarboxylate transporter permease n=1 Tax=Meridianimarinicoccus marinus TaxID=3231483 RepID=A0ABV3L1E7_9RHOB